MTPMPIKFNTEFNAGYCRRIEKDNLPCDRNDGKKHYNLDMDDILPEISLDGVKQLDTNEDKQECPKHRDELMGFK